MTLGVTGSYKGNQVRSATWLVYRALPGDVFPQPAPDRRTDRTHRSTDRAGGHHRGKSWETEEMPGRGALGPSSGQVSLTWEWPSCSSRGPPRASTAGSKAGLEIRPAGPCSASLPCSRDCSAQPRGGDDQRTLGFSRGRRPIWTSSRAGWQMGLGLAGA